jgi:hypothetical protein
MGLLDKLRSLRKSHVLALSLTVGGFVAPALPDDPPFEWNVPAEAVRAPSAEQRARQLEIARHWAPAFYQDTARAFYVGDFITKFNFDGDYNGKNNWESLAGLSTVPAYVYYAVSETLTHYFVNYSVFHPRDWHEYNPLDRHENDLEGVSLAIRKTAGMGELVAMQTLAHRGFWQYSNRADVASGLSEVDGGISFRGESHPRVYIEARGHGIYGCDARCDLAVDGDGILYELGDGPESPRGGDGNYTRRYRYAMIAMDADGSDGGDQGLWHRRNDICDTCTFGAWGKLRGDNYGENRAATPWLWREADRGPLRSGDMLCDPAFFFDARLNGAAFRSDYSHHYVSHAFRTHFMAEALERPARQAAVLPGLKQLWSRGFELAEPRREHSLCRPEPRVRSSR